MCIYIYICIYIYKYILSYIYIYIYICRERGRCIREALHDKHVGVNSYAAKAIGDRMCQETAREDVFMTIIMTIIMI